LIPLVLAAMFLGLVSTASGQRRGPSWSPGGYGNIAHPGIGHAPVSPAGGATQPTFFKRPVSVPPPATTIPGEIVILPVPVSDNSNQDGEPGTYLPTDGNPAPANTNLDPQPPVVINQNFVSPQADSQFANHYPATGRNFGSPAPRNPPNACASDGQATSNPVENDGKPTIYLIAFKDHHVVEALGYWIQGTLLHYVSAEYALNHASISLIDSDLSRRLNHERGIELTGLE
jgi:hypothetical protein